MKTNEFFEMMGDIDRPLIERADAKAVRKRPFIKIAVIAAAVALLAGLMLAVLPSMLKGEQITEDVVVWANIFTMLSPGNEDGLISGENYTENIGEAIVSESVFAEIISNNYADYIIGSRISIGQDGVYIGEKLDEVDIRTGWYHHSDGTEHDVMSVKAEVYEIGGVARKAAVAIRYLEKGIFDSDYYYFAANQNYELTTLSDFYTDLNADIYLNLSDSAFIFEVPEDKVGILTVNKYLFNDGAEKMFSELLLSLDGDGKIVGYYDKAGFSLKKGDRALKLAFVLRTSSRIVHHIYIFENGMIAIQGRDDGVATFDIGVDATDSLWELFEKTAHPEKSAYSEDGLVEATTGTVNEVVPE